MGSKPNLASMFNDLWQDHLKVTDAKDVVVNDSPRYVTFTYPGIPFWSFELDPRVPGLVNMLKICEDALYFGICRRVPEQNDKTLLLLLEMFSELYVPFHGMHEYKMTKDMYDPDLAKWPLKVKVSYTGRNGPLTNLQVEIFTADSNKLLMTRTQNFSYVNVRTRKLDDLPQWYTKGLQGKECAVTNVQIDRLIKPDKTYKQVFTVLFTDTDSFQHANYLTYVRFCQRALRQAVTERLLKTGGAKTSSPPPAGEGDHGVWPRKVTPDVMKKGVKTAKCRYFKECVMGDQINVHVWEVPDKPYWVFFSLEVEGGSALNSLRFQMSVEYFHD